jgi:hypothetical protein
LVCSRDERLEFAVAPLLRCDSRKADWLIFEKALRVRRLSNEVGPQRARRWAAVLWSLDPSPVIGDLRMNHLLLGDVAGLIDEWARDGPSFDSFAVSSVGPSAAKVEPRVVIDWVRERLIASFSRRSSAS